MTPVPEFAFGAWSMLVLFAYIQLYRHRNFERRPGETFRDRVARLNESVLWHRLVLGVILSGLAAVVLWNGVGTVLGWLL